MKILMINHHRWSRSNHRAGIFAQLLVSRGHEVTLMVISDNQRLHFSQHSWKGVNIIESPDIFPGRLRSGWDPISIFRRKKWLKGHIGTFDLVHLFETRPATIYPGLYIKKKLGIPLIIDWIDWWGRGGLIDVNRPRWYRLLFGKIETFFEEHFRKYADASTVISSGLAKRAIGLGVKAESILHLRPGVDLERFKHISTLEARKSVKLPIDKFIIGFGSQESFLDVEEFLGGVQKLLSSGVKLKLLLLGNIQNATKELLEKYELQDSVITPGFVTNEDYPIYLSACDAFGMPFPETNYNIGRWPNKFGEYLACGRPIVFNPVGDLSEFTGDNTPGITCNFNPSDFMEAFKLLYDSKELREKLGNQSRKLATEKFRWDKCIDKLEMLYVKQLDNCGEQ